MPLIYNIAHRLWRAGPDPRHELADKFEIPTAVQRHKTGTFCVNLYVSLTGASRLIASVCQTISAIIHPSKHLNSARSATTSTTISPLPHTYIKLIAPPLLKPPRHLPHLINHSSPPVHKPHIRILLHIASANM